MKEILKSIIAFVVKVTQTLISLVDVFCFGHPFQKRAKLCPSHSSVSILANGPSARNIINNKPELLINGDLLAMNDAAATDMFMDLKPCYYILLDPAYFGGKLGVKGEKEISNNTLDSTINKIHENLNAVDWNLTLLLPSSKSAESFAQRYTGHDYINVVRYNASKIYGFENYVMWAYNKGWGVPSSKNILIPALMLMINAGYDTIYLYGAEFSWTKYMDIDEDNGLLFMNDRHFYNKEGIRYFEKGSYKNKLFAIAEVLGALDSVAVYASKKNVKVINRTPGSFIDSFSYENSNHLLE